MVILQFIFFVFVFIVVMALVTVLRIITGLNKTRRKFMDFGRQQQNTTDAYNQNPKIQNLKSKFLLTMKASTLTSPRFNKPAYLSPRHPSLVSGYLPYPY